ncbi:hypothetical protein B0H10DRAFT_1872878 [Mycena sp. CBHHK59/15]|nr:hypothetical protein B0H10DRAFT_1872878 [Mycena sp. CBHHK59/15]
MLVWIKSALSPQQIRDRLTKPDSSFQKALVSYLESAHVARRGLHDIIVDEVRTSAPREYADPTQLLPTRPPPLCDNCTLQGCPTCALYSTWKKEYLETVDDLILRSNVHTCRGTIAGTDLSKPLKPGAKIKYEVKGCTRKDGSCSARFPRDVFMSTEVDPNDGSLNMKKLEPTINTVTPALAYTMRCNTDVTSLLSV